MRKLKINKTSGITLIALVVTIIVLLILAGISIQMLTGDNGILTRTTDVKERNHESQIQERVHLAYLAALSGGKGQAKEELLRAELDNEFGQDGYELSEDLTTVTIDGKEYDIGGRVTPSGGGSRIKDKNGTSIATTTETTPFLPNPTNNEITNNDLSTGLTIKDENQNEWVWIEVPKSITASATDDAGIKTALENYVYVQNAKNTNGTEVDAPLLTKTDGQEETKDFKTTTAGYTDTYYEGCGLSSGEYATKYSAMLNSIKENGGFYIGRYETGYELPDGSINNRRDSNKSSTEDHTAVIKQNAYPYNYVTCSQAEDLAEGFKTGEKTTTLLFGVQWDLVLRHLSELGVSTDDLTSDSSTWGNYYNQPFDLNRGKYSKTDPWSTFISYTTRTSNKVTVENGVSRKVGTTSANSILLTTGAADTNCKKNIYDLAGNVLEWTLEKTSITDFPCSHRGGYFNGTGSNSPASNRSYSPTTYSNAVHRLPCLTLLM